MRLINEGGDTVEKVDELYTTYFHDVSNYLKSITRNESVVEELAMILKQIQKSFYGKRNNVVTQ